MVQDSNKYFPREPLKYTPKKNGYGAGNLDSDVRGLLVWCLIHCNDGDREMKQIIYKELCNFVKVHQIDGEEKLTERQI